MHDVMRAVKSCVHVRRGPWRDRMWSIHRCSMLAWPLLAGLPLWAWRHALRHA